MNPRKRRMIRRAILAGIPAKKLTPENILRFLQRERDKGRMDLTDDHIQDILFPNGLLNKPKVEETEERETSETETTETLTDSEETTDTTVGLSLDNTKLELQEAADSLNISYKKSFSKSKLLELINNN